MEENNQIFLLKCFNDYSKLKLAMKQGLINDDYHDIDKIAAKMIQLFSMYCNVTDFSNVTEQFKQTYINTESRIEYNETDEEKEGIGIIYDYICNYDFNKKKFNIFLNSMDIHIRLYSKCAGWQFGGKLRQEQAVMLDARIEVVPPVEAIRQYNAYIGKSDQIMEELDKKDIFGYIDGCIRIMVDLIRIQPFSDGNKRTFRSLFNLMLKRKNLPPVYIGFDESEEFRHALLNALVENDYTNLNKVYIRLICDSIVLLGAKELEMTLKNGIRK